MFCRIPCAKGWSELQENIRGRGGSQWIIRTGHVGAGALTRPAMRSIARRWRARLATRTRASGPTWAVVAGRSKGAVTNRKIRPVRRWSGDTVWIETSFTVDWIRAKARFELSMLLVRTKTAGQKGAFAHDDYRM